MVRALLVIAGLVAAALVVSAHLPPASAAGLDLRLYADGTAHVSTRVGVDPVAPELEVGLLGSSVDNLVAADGDGSLLPGRIAGKVATVDLSGSSSSLVTVDYDVHDLISKQGRIWTFAAAPPVGYSVLMPPNAVIVGMNVPPSDATMSGDNSVRLVMGAGLTEIRYVFGSAGAATGVPPTPPSAATVLVVAGSLAAAGAAAGMALTIRRRRRRRRAGSSHPPAPSPAASPQARRAEAVPEKAAPPSDADMEAVLRTMSDMREDDKEIVRFIFRNGRQALESDLRKKFLQPRTTMWRAVKRLERHGIIEISKKDKQNLVTLREGLKAGE